MPDTLGYKHGVTNTAAIEYNSVRCSSDNHQTSWTDRQADKQTQIRCTVHTGPVPGCGEKSLINMIC